MSTSIEFETRLASKYLNIRRSAEGRGLEFNLTIADIRKLLKAKKCAYTKIDLVYAPSGEQTPPPNALTFDRVDASKGYVKGNVVACCQAMNQFKGVVERGMSQHNISIEELFDVMKTWEILNG